MKHLVNGTSYYTLSTFRAAILNSGDYNTNYRILNKVKAIQPLITNAPLYSNMVISEVIK